MDKYLEYDVLTSRTQRFRDFLRYARGGNPVPEALDAQTQFLSDREELASEKRVIEALASVSVRTEVAAFVYEFFDELPHPNWQEPLQ